MNSAQPATSPRRRRIQHWLRWITTICWAGLIFDLSSSGFGASFTGWLLGETLTFLGLRAPPDVVQQLNFVVRKLAHLTEYAVFAQLLYVSLLGTDDLEWRPRAAWWSLLIAAAYSLSDELHQLFVPNRTASLVDCVIDTTGAALGLLAVYLVARWRQTSRRSAAATEASAAET